MNNLQVTEFIKKCWADPKIGDALKKAKNSSEVGELILKNGFEFKVKDLKDYIDQNAAMSDEELKCVAGGRSDTPDTLLALLSALKAVSPNWR